MPDAYVCLLLLVQLLLHGKNSLLCSKKLLASIREIIL
jgi:hypothetical protein